MIYKLFILQIILKMVLIILSLFTNLCKFCSKNRYQVRRPLKERAYDN